MYDIVFLSYNEAKADENWEALKARFPRAMRSHGVKGIVAAHQAAAAMCSTRFFWVVDADNIINDDFDFSYQWPIDHPHKDSVAVWRAKNNVNGLVYGYGGVKLLPRRRVLQIDPDVVDFTTSIGNNFHVIHVLASTTVIDSTPFEAWKSGFRECAKLSASVIHRQKQQETNERLETWCTKAEGPYADLVIQGAKEGRKFGEINQGDTMAMAALNDFEWLEGKFEESQKPKPAATVVEDAEVSNTDTVTVLMGLEDYYPEKPFLRSLRQTIDEYPEARWTDALSRGQIQSKKWLVEELKNAMYPDGQGEQRSARMDRFWRMVYICASWYGILGDLILEEFSDKVGQVRGFDLDEHAVTVANRLMKHWDEGWKFKSAVKDITDLNFKSDTNTFHRFGGEEVVREDTPSMIINTSCEHIPNFEEWFSRIPKGKLVVLQSNDYFDWHEHVNCVEDLYAFEHQTPLRTVLYSGELGLPKYNRFMRIGIT